MIDNNKSELAIKEHKIMKRLQELGKEYHEVLLIHSQKQSYYYMIKTQTILILQSQGEKATNITAMIKGMPEVNKALEEKLIAEANVKAIQEKINILKLTLRINEIGQ